jgi:hypothetical protein
MMINNGSWRKGGASVGVSRTAESKSDRQSYGHIAKANDVDERNGTGATRTKETINIGGKRSINCWRGARDADNSPPDSTWVIPRIYPMSEQQKKPWAAAPSRQRKP